MSHLFWKHFNNHEIKEAQQEFSTLDKSQQEAIFQELFQKSEFHRKPVMISLLRRELKHKKSFGDFYQSWFPAENMCNKTSVGGQIYQQHFPIPVRVFNAVNIHSPKEVISIGITWARNAQEERTLWEDIENAGLEKDKNNEVRHEQINKVADGELLGLFRVERDDNLGTSF